MTRTQKRRKLNRKRFAKKVVRNIIYFIVGFAYIIYSILKGVNKLAIYLFNKLPRLAKVGVVYTMVALSVVGVVGLTNPKVQTIIEEKVVEKVVALQVEEENNEEQVVEEETTQTITFDNENETNIYNTSIENGLTHEQALLVISISRHETGNWKSDAFKNANNFGGIMCNGATKIKSYDTYEEGLKDFVRILKNYYFDLGLTTVEEIGAKYCPVGAKNDPNGLNKYWVGGVSSFYESYLQK